MKIYLVGGAVRDTLLDLPVKEKDWVVVGATPEMMLARGFKPVGKHFPVFIHPKTGEEYALARTERKTGHGYSGFSFHADKDVSLEQDLLRRDLTINAIAMDENQRLIDPFHGAADLKAKKIKHVSAAFSEDPVRILRAARFYARFQPLGFYIAKETLDLMSAMVKAGEVDYLVAERVFQEMEKALGEDQPQYFFTSLRDCGGLKKLLPEIDNLFGVPAKPEYHPEVDTGIHCMMVVQQAARLSKDKPVRFAALTHDLGKALTPKAEWPSHKGHEKNGLALLTQLCKRLRVPNEYKDLAKLVMHYHGEVHQALAMQSSTVVKLLEKLDVFRRPERFEKFLLACTADFNGRLGFEDATYQQANFLRQCFQLAKKVDVKALIQAGFTGQTLAKKIHEARVNLIKSSKN
ncbi:MAG: multifunctional CCA addition/repair protein [Pseudomonadota bacterium]